MSALKSLASEPYSPAINANRALLYRLAGRVDRLTEPEYGWKSPDVTASVGQHVRHIVDHYHCFFQGLGEPLLSYDSRARDARLETAPRLGTEQLLSVAQQLLDMDQSNGQAVTLSLLVAPESEPMLVNSSCDRELLYLQSHTLHHMALIQVLLSLQNLPVHPEFAIAPSTPRQGACANE